MKARKKKYSKYNEKQEMCYSGRDRCENALVVVPRQVGIDTERVCREWIGELSTKRSIMDKPRKKCRRFEIGIKAAGR